MQEEKQIVKAETPASSQIVQLIPAPPELYPQKLPIQKVLSEIQEHAQKTLEEARKLGKDITYFIAKFPAGKGENKKMVEQETTPFVKIIVDVLARHNHIVRLKGGCKIIEETDEYVTLEAEAENYKVLSLYLNPQTGKVEPLEIKLQSGAGARRMYYLGYRADGSTYKIGHPYEQAYTRAIRKAWTSLIPPEILLGAKAIALRLDKVKTFKSEEEAEAQEVQTEATITDSPDSPELFINGASFKDSKGDKDYSKFWAYVDKNKIDHKKITDWLIKHYEGKPLTKLTLEEYDQVCFNLVKGNIK